LALVHLLDDLRQDAPKDLLLLSDEGSVCHPSNSVIGTPATLVGRWSVRGEVMRNLANMTGAFKND
jgi:hypothetical protein